jgi:ferredoxin
MRVSVDLSLCQDHGQCAIAAANVFEINDDGKLVYDANPDDSEYGNVEEAADVCPAQAIFFEPSSPRSWPPSPTAVSSSSTTRPSPSPVG